MIPISEASTALSWKWRVPKRLYGIGVVWTLVPMLVISPGRKAVAMEKGETKWEGVVGDWYELQDADGQRWDALDIAILREREKVTFLSRRAPDQMQTEHFRAVLFSKGAKLLPLPYSVGGKQVITVHWHESAEGEGPFLRLSDRWGEYLVDLRRRTTAEVLRIRGRVFVGEIPPGDGKSSTMSVSDYGDRLEVDAHGGPARELTHLLGEKAGRKVGTISGR